MSIEEKNKIMMETLIEIQKSYDSFMNDPVINPIHYIGQLTIKTIKDCENANDKL